MRRTAIVLALVCLAGVAGAAEKKVVPAEDHSLAGRQKKEKVEALEKDRNDAVEAAENLKADLVACRIVLENVAKSDTARAGDLFKALGPRP